MLPRQHKHIFEKNINRDRGHYRKVSDRGLDLLIERMPGQYIKAKVWDCTVMTERTRLIRYFFYMALFLKKIQ